MKIKFDIELLKKYKIPALIIIALTILIEIFGYNFRAIESLGYKEESGFQIEYGEFAEEISDHVVEFSDGDQYFPEAYIEILNIDQKVNNLYLDLEIVDGNGLDDDDEEYYDDEEEEDYEYEITIWAIDEGTALYYRLPTLEMTKQAEHKYIKMNLNGKAKSLRIKSDEFMDQKVRINDIKINVRRPFMFSISRIARNLLILVLLYLIRPSSGIYKEKLNIWKLNQYIICMLLIFLQLFFVYKDVMREEKYTDPYWEHHEQYAKLAVSLAEGDFYLYDEPSKELLAMDNPYDINLRREGEVRYIWDQAFYDGQYFVYFGVVPVLIFYLPYYLATGYAFPTVLGIFISIALLLAGIFLLLNEIVQKYYKKISFGLFMTIGFLAFMACNTVFAQKTPTFYFLPIIMAVGLVVWGLYFWFAAVRTGKIEWKRVAAGALCMALVAGCRPQMLLSSFLCIPILGPAFIGQLRNKEQKKDLIKTLTGFAVPYLIIAGFLMYYNYARFGSPFDFGANYNLTTNDMTKRGFQLDRIPLGIYTFFIQPPAFDTIFPFIEPVSLTTRYQGATIYERIYGGILMLNPILWANLYCFKAKKWFEDKRIPVLIGISLISAVIIAIADVQMAGILPRYMSDFGIFLALPMIFIVLEINERMDNWKLSKIFHGILFVITVFTAFVGRMLIYS